MYLGDRESPKGSDLLVADANDICFIYSNGASDVNAVLVSLSLNHQKYILRACYRSPSSDKCLL